MHLKLFLLNKSRPNFIGTNTANEHFWRNNLLLEISHFRRQIWGSGCGTADSTVASDTRGHRFECSYQQLLLNNYLLLSVKGNVENKGKRCREWVILKRRQISIRLTNINFSWTFNNIRVLNLTTFYCWHCLTTSHFTTPYTMNRARRWYTVVILLYDLGSCLVIFNFKSEGWEQITSPHDPHACSLQRR